MFRNLCLVLHGSTVILLSRYVVFKIIFYSISLSYVNNEQIYPTIRFYRSIVDPFRRSENFKISIENIFFKIPRELRDWEERYIFPKNIFSFFSHG